MILRSVRGRLQMKCLFVGKRMCHSVYLLKASNAQHALHCKTASLRHTSDLKVVIKTGVLRVTLCTAAAVDNLFKPIKSLTAKSCCNYYKNSNEFYTLSTPTCSCPFQFK